MSSEKAIGVGVIGLGFMGRAHITAYRAAGAAGFANRLVAVSDKDTSLAGGEARPSGNLEAGERIERLFDPAEVGFSADVGELLANDSIDLVSICTHTLSHVDLAIQALRAGKHVLVEKPVALSSSEVERLAAAASESDRLCMPAMCMRFWPGWTWLRESIHSGAYGRVRGAVFRRLASHPAWSPEFYSDVEKNGGALFDLHIHDADFIQWCFGLPASVMSSGTIDHLTTLYRFPGGPSHVVAEGGWDCAPGFAFEMSFTVVFERATADFQLGRAQPLLLCEEGQARPVEIAEPNGYDGEIRHLLAAISGSRPGLEASLEDAVALTHMLEAEGRSLETGLPVELS